MGTTYLKKDVYPYFIFKKDSSNESTEKSSLSWFITRELSIVTREVKRPVLLDPGGILPKINP